MSRLARFTAVLSIVVIAFAGALVLGSGRMALADDGPVKVTIKVGDKGFDPESVDVPMGSAVEITFVWDTTNHPDDQHIIVIPGLKLESEKIDKNNKQTVVKFVATKSGDFLFKCDFECDTHDLDQHGHINVTAGGGAGGSGGGGGAALLASKIVVDPANGVVVNGNSVAISANLQDKDGKPISRAEVTFLAEHMFLGRHGQVPIAVGKTDANGNAYAVYHPTNTDGGKLIARYDGGGQYDKSELVFNLAGSGQFQPKAAPNSDDDLHGMKTAAPVVFVLVIVSLWASFAFMLYQAWAISRSRSGGGRAA